MQKIIDALAYLIFFFTEAVPMLLNASWGALGTFLDAIGYVKAIVAAIIVFACYILNKITRD